MSTKASLDVSHTQWAIEGDTIVMTPVKAGSRAVKIRLDAACLPAVRR
jgi:hypothetical protein